MYKIVFLLISIMFVSCGGTANNLEVGNNAPDFTLHDSEGNSYTLSDYKGKNPVVIYFYPKANTPGCTTQACGIRDEYAKFKENGIIVFGISVDSKESIKEFIKEQKLNFPLLSDENKEVAKNYDVLNNIGIASRVTFIVDMNGKIINIMREVDVTTHANQVFELAKKLT